MSDIGQNLSNFASRLEAIAEKQRGVYDKGYSDAIGIGPPSGEIELLENGTFDIASYATAKVNVVASGGENNALRDYMEGTLNKVTPEMLSGLSTTRKNMFHSHTVTSIEIPSNVKVIGENCFYECVYAKELILHEGIEEIGKCAFYTCSALTTVVIPNSVKKLNDQVFNNCSGLTSVTIGTGITIIPTSFVTFASKLKTIDIPYGITDIYNSSFNHCGFESLVIPDSVKTIGPHAFSNDKQLQTVELSNSLTSIAEYLFNNCETLQNITIPSTVAYIGSNAFLNCYKLEYIDLTAYGTDTAFPTLSNVNAFTKTGSKTTSGTFEIRIPVGRKAELAAMANWSTYANNIVEVDENAPEVETIVFFINSEPYTAEVGMTWEEWVNSDYNLEGRFTIINGYVRTTENTLYYVVDSNYVDVRPTDTIGEFGYPITIREEGYDRQI